MTRQKPGRSSGAEALPEPGLPRTIEQQRGEADPGRPERAEQARGGERDRRHDQGHGAGDGEVGTREGVHRAQQRRQRQPAQGREREHGAEHPPSAEPRPAEQRREREAGDHQRQEEQVQRGAARIARGDRHHVLRTCAVREPLAQHLRHDRARRRGDEHAALGGHDRAVDLALADRRAGGGRVRVAVHLDPGRAWQGVAGPTTPTGRPCGSGERPGATNSSTSAACRASSARTIGRRRGIGVHLEFNGR